MKKILSILIFISIFTGTAFAAHPLITDDTGTQGKGKFQLEINGEFGRDMDKSVTQSTAPAATALTYGIIDPVDVIIGIPYVWTNARDSDTTFSQEGFGDAAISVKWRLYEKDGWSFALKPGLTIPTGDKDKQLGTGKMTYSLFSITTKELKPWAFHLNLGYIGNENKLDQRVSLWNASVAAELEVVKSLKLVANTGIQSNNTKGADTPAAFILGGLIYSITDNFDIDAGYKHGLTSPEVDNTFMAGITLRF